MLFREYYVLLKEKYISKECLLIYQHNIVTLFYLGAVIDKPFLNNSLGKKFVVWKYIVGEKLWVSKL